MSVIENEVKIEIEVNIHVRVWSATAAFTSFEWVPTHPVYPGAQDIQFDPDLVRPL